MLQKKLEKIENGFKFKTEVKKLWKFKKMFSFRGKNWKKKEWQKSMAKKYDK